MERAKHWLAVYTKPRWEKKVHRLLTDKGIEAYCPLNKVSKKWSDRTRIIEEPLFKSYVFVKVSEPDQPKVRQVNGILNYVYWNGKPAIIREEEIEIIRKFLNEYDNVEAIPVKMEPNQRVRIERGILMHQEGRIQKIMHNQVEVLIESLGYCLVARLDKTNLSLLTH